MLLIDQPVPVVPVFIRGTHEAMPRGTFLRRLEKVTVFFGEPVDPIGLEGNPGSGGLVVEALRESVAELGKRLWIFLSPATPMACAVG